jgi:hypothetical protein
MKANLGVDRTIAIQLSTAVFGQSAKETPVTTIDGRWHTCRMVVESFDGRRTAQVTFLHGYPSTAVTHVFHCRQFILADVFGFDFRRAAETTFFLVAAWTTQVPRRIRYSTTGFTCMGHVFTPLLISWLPPTKC